MVNQDETGLSLPTCSKRNTDSVQGRVEAGVLTSSGIQETWPWGHEKQTAGSKTPPNPHPREATRKFFVFPGLWTMEVRGGGKGFPVRNQNPKPVQCEIQIYTIFKCGIPKPRNLT